MREYRVKYFGAEGRYSKNFVDYMEVNVDGKILYAETDRDFSCDWTVSSNKILEAQIREQARAAGIDENSLIFFKSL